MIVLPKGTFTVIKDEAKKQTESGIFLGDNDTKDIDTGIIAFTSVELNELQGAKVRFRPHFGEELEIEGIKHLYFRDYDSSIWYRIE